MEEINFYDRSYFCIFILMQTYTETTPPCQNVAKFGVRDDLLATGGDDNCVHVWELCKEEDENKW